jgi:hypothetical protein
LYTDPSPLRDLTVLNPNSAVIPDPSFLKREIFELCRLFINLGIFTFLIKTFLIPKENIKKKVFNCIISDLSG